jgi:hypothetical protein
MTLQEAQAVLARIGEDTPSQQQTLPDVRQRLGDCLSVLKRETSFREIPPGASVPTTRYQVVEAQNSVENAIKALEQDDRAEMLKHVQNALELLRRA